MSKKIKIRGLEITTFKLKRQSCEEFIVANADIDAWLKKQKGFQSRVIAQENDGTVMDLLIWDSQEEGRSAMHRIMTEMASSPVHDMIDQRTVSWNIYPLHHSVGV